MRFTPILTGSSVPIYRQIVEQVAHAFVTGAIGEDDQLPSVRELAVQLVVNPNTVARAYGELVRDGFAESRAGRGVFITRRRQVYAQPERKRRLEQAAAAFVSEATYLGFPPDHIRHAVNKLLESLEMQSAASASKESS